MRYLAIVASAATYWMLVATVRLMVHGLPAQPATHLAAPVARTIEPTPCLLRSDDSHAMSKVAFVHAMNAVKPEVARCHEAHGAAGLAMVIVVVTPSGQVSSARVIGRFEGTPTGACVEQAVSAARFPASDDGLTTPYPFELR